MIHTIFILVKNRQNALHSLHPETLKRLQEALIRLQGVPLITPDSQKLLLITRNFDTPWCRTQIKFFTEIVDSLYFPVFASKA
jgi:hypothetical protein